MATHPGYTYDTTLDPSPVSTADLEELQASVLWTAADRVARRRAGDLLVTLAAGSGDVDTLRLLVDDGNEEAAALLTALAARTGDEELLGWLVYSGVEEAADRWAEIASARGDLETVSRMADEGSDVAVRILRDRS